MMTRPESLLPDLPLDEGARACEQVDLPDGSVELQPYRIHSPFLPFNTHIAGTAVTADTTSS